MPRTQVARFAALATVAVLAVAACRPTGSGPSPTVHEDPSAPSSSVPTSLKVGLGYIPSVQFAPFYLADQAGYYEEAGLEVVFENKIDPDLVTLVGQGAIDVGVADGTSVIPAVSQGIPVRYVATIYGTYPSIVFSMPFSGIETAEDLRGRKIGIPGKYGSSWIMLQALLDSAGMTPEDVTIVEYPDFGQGAAVQQGAVDAATGFANNEPVLLSLFEENDAEVIHVDGIVALPGPGLITGNATLATKRDAIAAFVAATLRAMHDIEADSEVGLEAAIAAVPELAAQRDNQAVILDATVQTWARPGAGPESFGVIDEAGWQASIDYLAELGLVPNPVEVADLVDPTLLPATP